MADNTIRLDNVSGLHIIFRNFRGRSTPVTIEGDRSFCLEIFSSLLRDQLAARGCNIKTLRNGTEFVNVAVRIAPTEQRNAEYKTDNLWQTLDIDHIDKADLEFIFHEYNINGKKGTKIYLKNARFYIKDIFGPTTIDVRWPDIIRVSNSTNETNNTEDNTMKNEEYMSVDETILSLGVVLYAYRTHKGDFPDDDMTKNLFKAIDSAHHYMSEVKDIAIINKAKTKTCDADKPMITGYGLEKAGDFAAIKQVIFNDPATIVIWWDDTKTVVKCQKGDTFDKEKGLAMAICKRLYGNESNYNNVINKWVHPKQPKKAVEKTETSAKKDSKSTEAKSYNVRKLRADELLITDSWRECVRKRLAQNGWSQHDLFRRSGVSAQTISRIVGKYGPSPLKVVIFDKINETLNIIWKVEGDALPSSKKKERSSNLIPLTDELINSVREMMKERGISLSDLSRMSGVSLSAIGRYFSGNSPRPKAMHKRKYDAIMKAIDSSKS